MGFQTDVDFLRARFVQNWKSLHPDVKYLLDNTVEYEPQPNEAFVVLAIAPSTVNTAAFQYAAEAQTGRITIKVCVPAQEGVERMLSLADDALSIFKNWRSDDYSLRVNEFNSRIVSATDKDPYCQFILVGSYQSTRAA